MSHFTINTNKLVNVHCFNHGFLLSTVFKAGHIIFLCERACMMTEKLKITVLLT